MAKSRFQIMCSNTDDYYRQINFYEAHGFEIEEDRENLIVTLVYGEDVVSDGEHRTVRHD